MSEQEKFELKIRHAERAHDRNWEHVKFLNEAAAKDARESVKLLLAINGGAAIALLAFAGALIARSTVQKQEVILVLGNLSWFAAGVSAAAVAGALAYFTNFFYAAMAALRTARWEEPFIEETRRSNRWKHVALVCHFLGVAAAVVSLGLFLAGLFEVKSAMLKLI
ncbi:MAG TPA: hypothetical protein VM755_01020 [Stellaceae bacterium]|nr:hypothetical protein [Stellaceae bacterium]